MANTLTTEQVCANPGVMPTADADRVVQALQHPTREGMHRR